MPPAQLEPDDERRRGWVHEAGAGQKDGGVAAAAATADDGENEKASGTLFAFAPSFALICFIRLRGTFSLREGGRQAGSMPVACTGFFQRSFFGCSPRLWGQPPAAGHPTFRNKPTAQPESFATPAPHALRFSVERCRAARLFSSIPSYPHERLFTGKHTTRARQQRRRH